MTADEIREAIKSLGLTSHQAAAMLGYSSHTRISEIVNGKKPSESVIRLLRAYLAGYRPDDWPESKSPPA